MEIRLLKYFMAVAEEESFTKAASILNLTQPTLSRQLSDLEEELGVQLFVRGKRKVTLTDEGLLLKKRASEILTLVEKTEEEVKTDQGKLQGTIAIGAGETSGFNDLVPVIHRFHAEHPDVKFEITSGAADAMRELLNEGLLDLALFITPAPLDAFSYIHLPTRDQLGILACKDAFESEPEYIVNSDLRGKMIGVPGRKEVREKIDEWLGDEQDKVQSFLSHNLVGNAAKLMNKDTLFLITSQGSVDAYDPQKYFWIPVKPTVEFDCVIAWKKSTVMSGAVKTFIQELKETYQGGE